MANIKIVKNTDSEYSKLLKKIKRPPELLYCQAYYDILLQHGKYLDKCKSKDTENNLIFKNNLETLDRVH